MKTILAAFILAAMSLSSWAGDSYVILKLRKSVTMPDGIKIQLREGDCLLFAGKSDSGAWVQFRLAGLMASVPWHDAQIVPDSEDARRRYAGVLGRSLHEYKSDVKERDIKRKVSAQIAAERSEQDAIRREEWRRQDEINELRDLRDELDRLKRKMKR